jgi:hypothetical protein
MDNKQFIADLELKVRDSYGQGISGQGAQDLAGEFLAAMFQLSDLMGDADLDTRMRKSGLKAVRAGVYMEAATADVKKPSDTFLNELVAAHPHVLELQKAYDEAEVELAELERVFGILKECHVHFRKKSGEGF